MEGGGFETLIKKVLFLYFWILYFLYLKNILFFTIHHLFLIHSLMLINLLFIILFPSLISLNPSLFYLCPFFIYTHLPLVYFLFSLKQLNLWFFWHFFWGLKTFFCGLWRFQVHRYLLTNSICYGMWAHTHTHTHLSVAIYGKKRKKNNKEKNSRNKEKNIKNHFLC